MPMHSWVNAYDPGSRMRGPGETEPNPTPEDLLAALTEDEEG